MNAQFKNDKWKGRQRAFPATHDSDGHHFYRMNISPVSSYKKKKNHEDLQGTSSALMPGNPQREHTTNNSLTRTHPTIKCPT